MEGVTCCTETPVFDRLTNSTIFSLFLLNPPAPSLLLAVPVWVLCFRFDLTVRPNSAHVFPGAGVLVIRNMPLSEGIYLLFFSPTRLCTAGIADFYSLVHPPPMLFVHSLFFLSV